MSRFRIANVFGPIPSRRLHRSLGVDLVPQKACSYDCVYCQAGRTTIKTVERREYVPTTELLCEIEQRLATGAEADWVTITGSGEPTLHRDIGDIIATIKTFTKTPVAVLTNGSLLWDPEVRADLAAADLVIPNLDAGTPAAFARINRPHDSLDHARVVDGLTAFRAGFSGQIWLEVFLVEGLNTDDSEIAAIARLAERLAPDRIQLNTIAHPPSESTARSPAPDRVAQLAARFAGIVDVVPDFPGIQDEHEILKNEERILGALACGPATVDAVAAMLGLHPNETLKILGRMARRGTVAPVRKGTRVTYAVVAPQGET